MLHGSRDILVQSRESLGGKNVLVLKLTPGSAETVRLCVAPAPALVVRRESGRSENRGHCPATRRTRRDELIRLGHNLPHVGRGFAFVELARGDFYRW